MRKTVIFTFLSLFVVTAALPAQASLADRKSDEVSERPAHPAPYSGQTVRRGQVKSDDSAKRRAVPAPYSGRKVIRGEVQTNRPI
jgi:hypothetical protein